MPATRSRSRLADPMPEAKPRSDAYVGLLAISLVAMLTGTVFLLLDYMGYPDSKAPAPVKYTPPAAPTPAVPGGGTSQPPG